MSEPTQNPTAPTPPTTTPTPPPTTTITRHDAHHWPWPPWSWLPAKPIEWREAEYINADMLDAIVRQVEREEAMWDGD